MASEAHQHIGTQGLIREKNRILDLLEADSGNFVLPFAPGFKILTVANPDTARFLLSLKPEFVKKAGFGDKVFGGDLSLGIRFLHLLIVRRIILAPEESFLC